MNNKNTDKKTDKTRETIISCMFGSHVTHFPGGVENWLRRAALEVKIRVDGADIVVEVSAIDRDEDSSRDEDRSSRRKNSSWFSFPVGASEQQIIQCARDHSSLFWELDHRISRRDLGPQECPLFDSPHCSEKRKADPDNSNEFWGGGLVGWVSDESSIGTDENGMK